jgi:hypothetical protein
MILGVFFVQHLDNREIYTEKRANAPATPTKLTAKEMFSLLHLP